MTLKEMKESSEMFVTPAQAAKILKCDPAFIRYTAHNAPERLGFPVLVVGNRTKINRKQFLEYLGEAS